MDLKDYSASSAVHSKSLTLNFHGCCCVCGSVLFSWIDCWGVVNNRDTTGCNIAPIVAPIIEATNTPMIEYNIHLFCDLI